MDFDDVLIRLRRQYSEHEIIGALDKKISALEVEKGILLSEIDELKDTLERYQKFGNKILTNVEIDQMVKEHHTFKQFKKLMANRRTEIRALRKKNLKYGKIIYEMAKKMTENNIEWQYLIKGL